MLGAVAAKRAVLGPIRAAGQGTILFTTGGAAIKPYPERAGVGISFAGEVAYARMLHDALAPEGIHVAPSPMTWRSCSGATTRSAGGSRRDSPSTDAVSGSAVAATSSTDRRRIGLNGVRMSDVHSESSARVVAFRPPHPP